MFKRANKVTALLVAAASVMSIVPAMATTRLGTKDGHIKGGAIAFEDGKYIYDGYRTEDDDTGIYYNDGTEEKEKFNEDLREYELTRASKYGTKYAFGTDNDGKDQYLLDLSNGKIVDDETPEDKADSVKSKLKAILKKTNRYSTTGSWNTVDLGDSVEVEDYNDNTRAFRGQFGEVWYKYTAAGDVAGAERKASFTVNLGNANFPTIATAKSVGGRNYIAGTAKATILTDIKNDTVATNVFDVNLIQLNADSSVITGYAKTVGEISKTNTDLVTFANNYGVVLKGVEVTSTTASAASMNLGTLASAKSNNLALVLTSITTTTEVNLLSAGAGKAGTTTVDVTDKNGNVATLTVAVTSTNGISVSSTKKYFSEAQKAAALNLLSNSGSMYAATEAQLFASFEALGLDSFVVATGTSATKLTVAEARDAIVRYLETGNKGAYELNQSIIQEILNNALAKKIAANTTVTVDRGANPVAYSGFVNESGKYIDASNLANVSVYSQAKHKTVKIAEYNKRNADYGITVSIQGITAIAQDKDYIYTLTKVGVLEDTLPNPEVVTQYFVQKISKAQGDTKDGAYTPKSVESYQLDAEVLYKNGDSAVATRLIRNIADTRTVNEDGFTTTAVRVKDGTLYVTGVKDDNTDKDVVKVFKIVLKKVKVDAQDSTQDVDVYIAKKDGDNAIDIRENTRATAVSYDVDGNTWVVSKGTVTKFDGTEKKDIYTCDRTFDHIDAYDEKNLIVWGDDGEVYSNVGEGTKKTQEESTAVAPVIVTGWVQGTDGTWTFNDAAGTKVVSKWINVGGAWYYLKADGIMATGWLNDNGTWYYLQGSGAMATGWLNDNGTWYYLAGSGAMLANTVVDGYTLGASGAWVK